MLPSSGLEGGIALLLTRAATVASLLSVFGALAFQVIVMPRVLGGSGADAVRAERLASTVIPASILAAAAAMLAWLLLQAAEMASATTVMGTMAALWPVLAHTVFGHLLALQAAGVVLAGLAYWRRWQRIALALATIVVLLQAGHGHAASMDGPSLLLAASGVHLLAAGGWLGGLIPLAIVVATAPARTGAMAARWFSPLGKVCVAAVAGSAVVQSWVLVGGIPGLAGTPYGWVALVKIGLLGVLVAFAVVNRYRLAPALLTGKRALVSSIVAQTGFALAIIVAAAALTSIPPGMHVQPIWPFPVTFTLDAIDEDAELWDEAAWAVAGLAAAIGLLGCAWIMRHPARWAAAGAAVVIAGLALPHFDLMFAPASPTRYFQSPTGFAATSILAGATLFQQNCVSCHGASGRGDGPLASRLPLPPANLTQPHLLDHSDGELYGWLSDGIEGPEGGLVMPGFAASLSSDEIWSLIDYIRAHAAAMTGAWTPAFDAPGFQADCDGRVVSSADLHGGYVRIVAGSDGGGGLPGVTIILTHPDPKAALAPGVCVASDPALLQAYALLTGMDAALISGMQFLVDGDGLLRAAQKPDAAPNWNDPAVLAAKIGALRAQRVEVPGHRPMAMPMP